MAITISNNTQKRANLNANELTTLTFNDIQNVSLSVTGGTVYYVINGTSTNLPSSSNLNCNYLDSNNVAGIDIYRESNIGNITFLAPSTGVSIQWDAY